MSDLPAHQQVVRMATELARVKGELSNHRDRELLLCKLIMEWNPTSPDGEWFLGELLGILDDERPTEANTRTRPE